MQLRVLLRFVSLFCLSGICQSNNDTTTTTAVLYSMMIRQMTDMGRVLEQVVSLNAHVERKQEDNMKQLIEILQHNTQSDEKEHYKARGCAYQDEISQTGDYYVIDGRDTGVVTGGSSSICRMWQDKQIKTDHIATNMYSIQVTLYNLYGSVGDYFGETAGHLGLFFNAQAGSDNYDYAYVRIHTSSECFQSGYTTNGRQNQAQQHACINRPRGKKWFTLKLDVTADTVTAHIDGVIIGRFNPRYSLNPSGGVMTWKSHNNVAYFKNLLILPLIN